MKKIIIGLGIFILVIGIWLLKLFWDAGQFKSLTAHFKGVCQQVGGVVGPEDLVIHPDTNMAYISAYDRRAVTKGRPAETGVYAYDLNVERPRPRLLVSGPGEDFRPHGLSLYTSPNGDDRLFVINHAKGEHSIEIYSIEKDRLSHVKTIRDPLLISPNDIVAVGPEQFYVTNDHKHRSGLKRIAEDYLRLSGSNVVYFDGQHFSIAAEGFQYANGINVSLDQKTLYLSTTVGKKIHVFKRDIRSGILEKTEVKAFDTGLDNIDIDATGAIWITGHPKLLTFVSHAKDPQLISPSQILKVSRNHFGGFEYEEVYLNLGEELSAASVAVVKSNRMLVGSVFDAKILDCQLMN